jgi:protein-S-isoprenylcysteine O-methyltransferase Ste14
VNHKESFDRLVADFGDYSQKVERTELRLANEISQATTALIGLVTCFGVPLGLLQVFGTKSTTVWIMVAAYLAILGFVPAGDYIIGLNLPRRWRTAKTPTRLTRIIWGTFWITLIGTLLLAEVVPTS